MYRFFVVFISLLLFIASAKAQEENSEQHAIKKGVKNAVFDKAFNGIVTSSRHYFKNLQNDSGMKSISDTTYTTHFNFAEHNDADLTCAKDYVSLGVRFHLSDVEFNAFVDKLGTTLPVGFVYTKEYDPSVKIATYTFFAKAGAKNIPPDYPEKVALTIDAENIVMLGFFKYRKK